MAWIIANKSSLDYIEEDAVPFILSFMRAWMSTINETDFISREDVIDVWIESRFDLIEFTESEHKKILRTTKKLNSMSLPPYLHEQIARVPHRIINMCQTGEIDDEDLRKFGPSLVLEYILQMSVKGTENRAYAQAMDDCLEDVTLRRLKREHDAFDVDPRRLASWDSDMVQALLGAVDKDLLHPSVIRKQARPPRTREPWLPKSVFFEILESGLGAVDEEIDDIADILGDTSLGA